MVAKARKPRRKPVREPARAAIGEAAPEPQVPAVIVLNPSAGAGKAAKWWSKVHDELRYWRVMPEVWETEAPGHAAELAKEAAAQGSSLVIAAGGDGTAHEVVQGLMEVEASASGTAFGHLPLGTGCDLAAGLGLPSKPYGMLRRLRKGRNTYIDVGVAEMAAGTATVRRYFLNCATVGLGPRVARRVRASKRFQKLGKIGYTMASVQELLAARPYQVSWQTDDGRGDHSLLLNLFICNGPSLAGGMRPCPGASYTSSVLHVTIAGELSLPAALSQFRRLSRNRPFDHPEIHSFTCRSIDLEGPDLDLETDGEIAGGLPARIWVRDSGLLLRMPS